jgi:hypothetical protein
MSVVVASTCSDGIKNQGESDIDCGGSNCAQCDDNASCTVSSDCTSLNCVDLMCGM